MRNDLVIPKAAWLTLNRACNFRCKWCYAQETDYNSDEQLSLDQAQDIVELLISIGVKSILLLGGEPTLWPWLIEFNCFCNEKGIETVIVTNAMRFGNNRYWEEYKNHPNTDCGVSLKSYSAESLKRDTGVTSFGLVTKGIKRATDFFKSGASVTYNKLCENSLVDIARYAMDCGAKSLNVNFCSPTFKGNGVDIEYMLPPHVIASNVIRDYEDLCRATDGHIVFSMRTPLCNWPEDFVKELELKNQLMTVCQLQKRSGIVFDCDGSIMMCNGLFNYLLGKYRKDFSNGEELLTLLNNEQTSSYYDALRSYPSEKCKSCKWYGKCAGGCPLMWLVYNPEEVIKGF
jgi:radical SAM protein with 4Fe4S-binding SPASM domain